jgi:2-hydroxychromene-2-carboxylate isomerase
MPKLVFYFDFLSPFSFFAWKRHQKLLSGKVDITYAPVLMGKLFSQHNFPGPGEIPAKRNYELKKCFRYATKQNIEFSPPKTFPFNPLAINRCATRHASQKQQVDIIELLFNLVWSKGKILDNPDIITKELLTNNLNPDIVERSFERPAKLELKKNINDALAAGAFGVPSFYLDQELFWGNDSLEDLINYLDGNDNWDKALYNQLLK